MRPEVTCQETEAYDQPNGAKKPIEQRPLEVPTLPTLLAIISATQFHAHEDDERAAENRGDEAQRERQGRPNPRFFSVGPAGVYVLGRALVGGLVRMLISVFMKASLLILPYRILDVGVVQQNLVVNVKESSSFLAVFRIFF